MFCFRNWILWGQSSFGNFRNSSKEIWGGKYQIAKGKYRIDVGAWKFKKTWWNQSRRFRKSVNWQWFSNDMQKLFSNIFDQCHKLVHKYLPKPQWLSLKTKYCDEYLPTLYFLCIKHIVLLYAFVIEYFTNILIE